MSTPFYVSPQQAMADRAEYARKGIARGRSVVVLQYTDGIVFVAENPSRSLHKISEIYDRIAFAAVGKYNEFENLRIGGVRYADLRGFTYDRADVTARGLANVYAQTLGTIFSSAAEKPYEVELIVAEVGAAPEDDQIYRLPHDGSIVDEHGSLAVGGNSDQINSYLEQRHRDDMTLAEAVKLGMESLARDNNGGERGAHRRPVGGRAARPQPCRSSASSSGCWAVSSRGCSGEGGTDVRLGRGISGRAVGRIAGDGRGVAAPRRPIGVCLTCPGGANDPPGHVALSDVRGAGVREVRARGGGRRGRGAPADELDGDDRRVGRTSLQDGQQRAHARRHRPPRRAAAPSSTPAPARSPGSDRRSPSPTRPPARAAPSAVPPCTLLRPAGRRHR